MKKVGRSGGALFRIYRWEIDKLVLAMEKSGLNGNEDLP